MHIGIGERAIDENAVSGIGYISKLRDPVAAQEVVKRMLPADLR